MPTTPDDLDGRFTLLTAVARYDVLRTRDALAAPDDEAEGDVAGGLGAPESAPLSQGEALELLSLGELIARKALYGRQLSVRSARRAGASWSQIGAALGTSKQSAWEAHHRWIDEQAKREEDPGHWGWDENSEFPRGGHFAAMEQPDLFTTDLRAFFQRFR
ncbi:hypothetical protein [Streptomyces sp. NPDC012510]|uniref:hypothetical protein n=1 Tax=Streptomyces sp. NPDC012510 TaxID=3364838 RepID=UPI0036E65F2A